MSSSSSWWASKMGNQTPVQPAAQLPPQFIPPNIPPTPQPTVAESCPSCRSGNYGKLTPETKARCYDCGYPLIQSGSGMGGSGSAASGPPRAARQAEGGGWNPSTIVGKLS